MLASWIVTSAGTGLANDIRWPVLVWWLVTLSSRIAFVALLVGSRARKSAGCKYYSAALYFSLNQVASHTGAVTQRNSNWSVFLQGREITTAHHCHEFLIQSYIPCSANWICTPVLSQTGGGKVKLTKFASFPKWHHLGVWHTTAVKNPLH